MTARPLRCDCGCGASLRGWLRAGAHLRVGVRRVYAEAHGLCRFCGQPLDQYGECDQCGPSLDGAL